MLQVSAKKVLEIYYSNCFLSDTNLFSVPLFFIPLVLKSGNRMWHRLFSLLFGKKQRGWNERQSGIASVKATHRRAHFNLFLPSVWDVFLIGRQCAWLRRIKVKVNWCCAGAWARLWYKFIVGWRCKRFCSGRRGCSLKCLDRGEWVFNECFFLGHVSKW